MTDDRAVSEVVGFVLVFSLVAVSVAIVSVNGLSALENTRDNEQIRNAERAFDVLADNLDDIYEENAPSRATEISLTNAQLEAGDPVRINLTRVDSSTSTVRTTNYTTMPIVYEGRTGARVVYSAGAVFRVEDDGGGLVSDAPPFIVGGDAAVVPIIQLRLAAGSPESVGGSTVRVRTERSLVQPVITRPRSPYDEVVLNITTPRNDLWARYLSGQPATSCETPRDDTVECTIDDPDRLYVTVVRIDVSYEI